MPRDFHAEMGVGERVRQAALAFHQRNLVDLALDVAFDPLARSVRESERVCMCVCVCVCVYICICIYIYIVNIYTHTRTHSHTQGGAVGRAL